MSLTIDLDQATMRALEADAAMRQVSCVEIIRELLHNHYTSPEDTSAKTEALFRAEVKRGRDAIRRGDFLTHEEVAQEMAERRARILERLTSQ